MAAVLVKRSIPGAYFSGGSREGARGALGASLFWTKVKPEGPKIFFFKTGPRPPPHLSQGLDDRPRPHLSEGLDPSLYLSRKIS